MSFHIFHAWEDVSVVNHSGSLRAWVHEEDEEAKFKEEVEWDECKNEAGPLVDDIKKTEHDPIGEPLLIIFTTVTLQCNKAHEAWVGNSDCACDVT